MGLVAAGLLVYGIIRELLRWKIIKLEFLDATGLLISAIGLLSSLIAGIVSAMG